MREHWSLVEVAIPLVLVLALGAIGVIPNRAALGVATAVALLELAANRAYAAINHGASRAGALASAMITLALGISMVLQGAYPLTAPRTERCRERRGVLTRSAAGRTANSSGGGSSTASHRSRRGPWRTRLSAARRSSMRGLTAGVRQPVCRSR